MTKKIVISGYYGFKNFGDEAILSVLTNKLKGANITVFSSDPEWTEKTYNVSSVRSFDFKNVIKTINACDVLVSGGGSLLQNVTSLKSLIYYALIIFLALIMKKQVIIFAQGIGPINGAVTKWLVGALLKRCSYVSVRDENSLNLLKQMNVNAELLCDPIYSLDIAQRPKTTDVGVQLRDFKTMNIDFINHLAMEVAKSFSDRRVRVYSLQDTLDLEVCKQFKRALNVIAPDMEVEVLSNLSSEELTASISELEYMIGMRFHAILVALKTGTKSLAINYDIKVEKLANEADIPLIELNNFDFEKSFKDLLAENPDDIKKFTETKAFDWSGFDRIMN